jgi:hypothetical protein
MNWNVIICDSIDFGRFFFFIKLRFKISFENETDYFNEVDKLLDALLKINKHLMFVYLIPQKIGDFVCINGLFSGRADSHLLKEIKSEFRFFLRSQPN